MNIRTLSTIALYLFSLSYSPNIFADIGNRKPNLKALNSLEYISFRAAIQRKLVQSWCSPTKIALIMDTIISEKLETCVEVGVFNGSSFLPIASSLQYLGQGCAYAIDAWSNEEAIKYMDINDPNRNWWAEVNMYQAHYDFQTMIRSSELEPYSIELPLPSEDAIYHIDEIDFLHLDGNYTSQGSLKDAMLYLPKVRIGGCILVSNAYYFVNRNLLKLESLHFFEQTCEIIGIIDDSNTILYRKTREL